jgi:hypothetical protein
MLINLKLMADNNITTNPHVSLKAYDLAAKLLGYFAPTELKQDIQIKQEQPLFLPLND